MCGIAGIWRFNGSVEKEEIVSFTDSMFHRGPDGSGYEVFSEDNLALGHRRLSILDLTDAGKQPMSYANERYWLTFNGEIYNFIEIKDELISKGFTFISNTDSEVILAAYIFWKKDCFKKFNGMWAIAIWDSKEKSLFLCRDRYGVKPLHYSYLPNVHFAFASETIAFRYLKGFTREIDNDNFNFAITNPTLLEPTGETIYKNIKQLKAGHYAELKLNGEIKISRWWNTNDYINKVNLNYKQQVDEFRGIFLDAIKLRLRSDVSVASALSGGVDSSSVFCSINYLAKNQNSFKRLPGNWQQAYSISFPNTSVDEAKYVELIKRELNADVTILTPDYENLVSDIERTTSLFDAITGTPIIALTDVYKGMRRNNITVSMDGHGGDELLFGYSSSVYKVLSDAFSNNNENKKDLIEIYLSLSSENVTENEINRTYERLSQQTVVNNPSNKIKQLIKGIINRKSDSTKVENSNPFLNSTSQKLFNYIDIEAPKHFTPASKFLFEEFHFNEIPYNLRDFDRAAMQNQIEIRMPLMDYRLVDFCFSLPTESKIGHGYTKRILRDAMKGIVPEQILQRKTKIGLGAPTKDWFNNELSGYIMDITSSQNFLSNNYWNGQKIREFVCANCKNKSWTSSGANDFWKILNAYLIIK